MPPIEHEIGNDQSSKFSTWIWALPFVLLIVILLASPNFRWNDGHDRLSPYGGDFLQEWIGGQVVLSADRKRLYDQDWIKTIQHDRQRVGFSWPEKDYFPMVYPPAHYMLVSPVARLDYRTATIVWACGSTLAFWFAAFLLYRYYEPLRPRFLIWFVAAICFAPWLKCLAMGQKSSFILLLLTVTFLLQHHRKSFFAGLVFGLFVLKPQLGFVIAAAMLFKGQWKFIAGAFLTACLLIAGSWWAEPSLWNDYLQIVSGMGNYLETGGYRLTESHSLWGATQLLLSDFRPLIYKTIAGALAIAILGCLAWCLKSRLAPSEDRYALQYSALIGATILVSPHFYTYDLTILLLPMALLLPRYSLKSQQRHDHWMIAILFALYLLAGLFPWLAETIRFQLSVVLVGFLVLLLSIRVQKEC